MQSHLFGNLQVEQAEIVFPFLDSIKQEDLPAETALAVMQYLEQDKQQLALQLFIAYRDGIGVVANEQIAEVYLAHYLLCTKPAESLIDNILFWLAWFTTIRLGILRGDRELALLPFSSHHNHAIQFNKALQLSYGLEIIVGIVKLLYNSFRPEKEEDYNSGIPWYTRLKERFSWERYYKIRNSSQFTNFMSNAIAWFMTNGLSLLCVAGLTWLGASALVILVIPSTIQLIGFGYDIYHDYIYAAEERDKHTAAQKLIIGKCQRENDSQITLMNILTTKARDKFSASSKKIRRVVIIAVGIFIGMVLLYFLPLLSPYIASHLPLIGVTNFLLSYYTGEKLVDVATEMLKTIGSTIVVAAGFLYGGLCGRLWRLESWKKSALWLGNFLKSNVLELTIASLLLYFGGVAAIPLIGATIVSLGAPVALFLTFIAVRSGGSIINWIWQQLQSPSLPVLTEAELMDLRSLVPKIEQIALLKDIELVKSLQTLSAKESSLFKKAVGFNNEEWLKHVRNWSLESTKRERSLSYQELASVCSQLRKNFSLPAPQPVDSSVQTQQGALASNLPNIPRPVRMTRLYKSADSITSCRPKKTLPRSSSASSFFHDIGDPKNKLSQFSLFLKQKITETPKPFPAPLLSYEQEDKHDVAGILKGRGRGRGRGRAMSLP